MGVLILLITATVAVVAAKWGKIGGVALNPDKLAISEEAEISGTGYLTVALFGLDTRETDEEMGSRSDTIMAVSYTHLFFRRIRSMRLQSHWDWMSITSWNIL